MVLKTLRNPQQNLALAMTLIREVVGQFGYYSPDGDVAVRVITTVAKAALLVDNMEYGGK